MQKSVLRVAPALFSFLLLLSCGGDNTSSNVQSPGAEKAGKTNVLEAGADLLQDKTPLSKLNMYLDGFHFYNGDTKAQMEAHHYCTKINEDLTQCIIYDGNTDKAKIMGVEYIVSEKLFKTLPAEERKLWHSHVYEVKSGELIAPGLPDVAEHELMEELVSTYGKTFHTWHTDQDLALPMGHPLIMMGFTKDGMLDPTMLKERDERFKVSSEEKRKNRADIPTPAIQPGANAWQQGEIRQLKIDNTAQGGHHHSSPNR
ncbi:OBAP family protein [Spirosoma sp. RP8]|uniref:OBAP family protein n=1 Tax=Spirosoma liriopis TaxID=2937440 RepID=A0ABT0HN84_9BACT|nr:OBAP family protein [Spirosoma liriopis]MCK8493631.1 OBAP family protein [Spirosoma liriopis]